MDPMEKYFEGLKIQKNETTSGVYCGVIVIKKSKMAHFVFSDDDSKKLIIVWPEYLNAPERCY